MRIRASAPKAYERVLHHILCIGPGGNPLPGEKKKFWRKFVERGSPVFIN